MSTDQSPNIWPFSLKPDSQEPLVRIGSKYDGGYIFPAALIARTDRILTFGLGLNWDFERQTDALIPLKAIHFYDHTITTRKLVGRFLLGCLLLPTRPIKRSSDVRRVIDYVRFISGTSHVTHFRKMIGNRDSHTESSVNAAFDQMPDGDGELILKCDIEGAEYLVLDALLDYAPRYAGLAIEFHDCGEHLDEITGFVSKLRETHRLDHFHVNNNSRLKGDRILNVIELSFSRKDISIADTKIPTTIAALEKSIDGRELDAPNNPNRPIINALFETPFDPQ